MHTYDNLANDLRESQEEEEDLGEEGESNSED